MSIWLLKRGFWLVFVEVIIIKFAWMFQLNFEIIILQVIWALGASMIILACLIHLPKKLVIFISLLVVFGHNLFDNFTPDTGFASGLWSFLHEDNLVSFNNFGIYVAYPLIPWIFVMPLGYYFGELYLPSVKNEFRIKKLWQMGLSCIVLFIVFRFINVYGDSYFWETQKSTSFMIMSFFNVSKYPPSLFFLLITIGPSLLFLAIAEKLQGKFVNALVIFGRVPMFFYIIHLYVIHLLALGAAVLTGFKASDMIIDVWVTEQPELVGYGFSLGVVYAVWVLIVIVVHPISKWYNNYKSNNRDKWWLSYL